MPFTIGLLANYKVITPIILISTALAGAFYCGYLCPFGLLQDLGMTLRKKFKLKKVIVPKAVDKKLRYLRYLLYSGVSILSIEVLLKLLKYDPRSNLYLLLSGKTIGLVMLISIILFFVMSMIIDRPFCKYLCMKGALYGVLSKLRVFSIVRSEKSCVNCGKCDRVCPMGIGVSKCGYVNSMDCVNCFDCIKACPVKKTLVFKSIPKNELVKKLGVLIMIGILFLAFEGRTEEADQHVALAQEIKEDIDYYQGVGEGYNGSITVKVGYVDNKIYKIRVIDHQEDYEWYSKAKKPIIEAVIAKQSTDIDGISGATYTSDGLIEAIANAMSKVE